MLLSMQNSGSLLEGEIEQRPGLRMSVRTSPRESQSDNLLLPRLPRGELRPPVQFTGRSAAHQRSLILMGPRCYQTRTR